MIITTSSTDCGRPLPLQSVIKAMYNCLYRNPKISRHCFSFQAGSLLIKFLACAAAKERMTSHFNASYEFEVSESFDYEYKSITVRTVQSYTHWSSEGDAETIGLRNLRFSRGRLCRILSSGM